MLVTLENMSGSKWDEVLEDLSKSFEHKILSLKVDDLIDFCVRNKTTRDSCDNFLKSCGPFCGKDSVLALQKKEEGDAMYQKKDFGESVYSYTDSIFHAKENDECLCQAYAHRSLALYMLGYTDRSLIDIDMALNCNCPQDMEKTLLLRKAQYLIELGQVDEGREILIMVLKTCNGKAIRKLIKNELEKIKGLKSAIKESETPISEVIGGENPDFVSASNYLSVYFDTKRGRHVIANKDIKVGDVLFVEEPFAFVNIELACYNCLKKTVSPIPCSNCVGAEYCSLKCRDKFWKSVHRYECQFDRLFKSVGIAHLSLRIILKASKSLEELRRIIRDLPDPVMTEGKVTFSNRGYGNVYFLCTNYEKYESKDMFEYIMTALLLASYLKKYTNYFPEGSDDEDLAYLTSIILRHILQMICNGFAVNFLKFKDSKGKLIFQEDSRIGTAIYPSTSMMNHSCEPSVFSYPYNTCLEVRAARPIKKGEEVFACYGVHARRMERARRQEILSEQYFFKCECEACSKKYDIQDVFTAFKCLNCNGPAITIGENYLQRICISCEKTFENSSELKDKVIKFYSCFKEGESLSTPSMNATLALNKFLQGWVIGRDIFYKLHKDLSWVADKIAECLVECNDLRRSILFLKCSVQSIEKRYGVLSLELAYELTKLGDIISSYVQSDKENTNEIAHEGLLSYEKAREIVIHLCGSHHLLVKQIDESKSILKELIKS